MTVQTASRERPAALRKRPAFWAALLAAGAGTSTVSWWIFSYMAHPTPQTRALGIALAAALGLLACSLVLRLALRRQRLVEARADLSDVEELTRRLRKKTVADESVGLKSRWEFYEGLNLETNRSTRYHHRFTILFVRLEGTEALAPRDKDYALLRVIEALMGRTRTVDLVARYSETTFAIILPETARKGADALVARLHADLRTALSQTTGGRTPLALRLGLAVFPTEASQPHALIDAAEEELLRRDPFPL
jgi:diguanylate cyclase (GGDEF)-like protein